MFTRSQTPFPVHLFPFSVSRFPFLVSRFPFPVSRSSFFVFLTPVLIRSISDSCLPVLLDNSFWAAARFIVGSCLMGNRVVVVKQLL